ncbi:Transcriptional regulator, AcrR family [hydrothermal vent metagenome]|uniref:Transcriptional regulator, AcrR family n=1 Tax=hydrothermal vent metagenome TaxID=652676 RepID=A0A3B0ZNJ7_9ZZZZ
MRNKIVSTADDLFYRQGFNHTSFSDIASAVGISRGNFYYHFKTKDDILAAVIENRKVGITQTLNEWNKNTPTPKERLHQYVDMIVGYQDNIVKYGCPLGTVCSELNKLENINYNDAIDMIALFRDWMIEQFILLGHSAEKSKDFAMHLLTCTQGITVVAQAFTDSAFIKREADILKDWLDSI